MNISLISDAIDQMGGGRQLQSITITTQPTTTSYAQGMPLDTSGIVVKALIGSTYVDVTPSITYSVPSGNTSFLMATDTTVTCKLTVDSKDYTTTYSITVHREACTVVYTHDSYVSFAIDGVSYSSSQTINCYMDSTIVCGIIAYSGGLYAAGSIKFDGTTVASISTWSGWEETSYTFVPLYKTTSTTIKVVGSFSISTDRMSSSIVITTT